MSYDLKPIKAPRASGGALRALLALLENPLGGSLAEGSFFESIGVAALRGTRFTEPPPALAPVFGVPHPAAPASPPSLEQAGSLPSKVSYETSSDFTSAYREGRTSPEAVAERFLEAARALDERHPPMRIMIAIKPEDLRAQARASAARWKEKKPLSPLDGVPVAVKDELDLAGFPTTVGTRFLGTVAASQDAEVVARLRAAGALLLGKANMHEIGLGVTGVNPHHGAARNPWDPERATGGSSSGPGAAVAAGLCPIAVGADGGGSIRIPAGFCGVVGLKPTFGRVSEHGAAELCWSVAHVGPLAACARDAALAYQVMAGPDPKDLNSRHQPPPHLTGVGEPRLDGVRLGIYRPWFSDADAGVVAACEAMVKALCDAGATVVEVDIPDLGLARAAHMVTIVSEMLTAHAFHYAEHREQYGLDTRASLALARRLKATDYVQAQRARARLWNNLSAALEHCDVIVSPTSACTAPLIPAKSLETGESDLAKLERIMRFATFANLSGLPAISFPAGFDAQGLPVGFQAMGRAWEEHLLLRLALVAEQAGTARTPRVNRKLLG